MLDWVKQDCCWFGETKYKGTITCVIELMYSVIWLGREGYYLWLLISILSGNMHVILCFVLMWLLLSYNGLLGNDSPIFVQVASLTQVNTQLSKSKGKTGTMWTMCTISGEHRIMFSENKGSVPMVSNMSVADYMITSISVWWTPEVWNVSPERCVKYHSNTCLQNH